LTNGVSMPYNNTMNTKKRKVAIVGALNVDIGGRPEAAFVPGDSIPGQVITALGGVGWNIARDCASLGAETAFFSVLGQDEHEALIRREAEEFGVSLAGCRWEEQPNNRYLYISGKGGDMVAAVNDMRLCEKIDTNFVLASLSALADYDVVVADANLPPETFRALAEGVTKNLVVDCVSAVKCGRLRDNLDCIHTLKANRMEAEMLTGQIEPMACVQALMEAGVKRAVVSLSGDGVLCGENGRIFRKPASGMPLVDTTGAGDSLTAALAVGLAHGLDLERCAEMGMAAAGITVGQPGAVTRQLSQLALG
jgi:pseudouridine kinase